MSHLKQSLFFIVEKFPRKRKLQFQVLYELLVFNRHLLRLIHRNNLESGELFFCRTIEVWKWTRKNKLKVAVFSVLSKKFSQLHFFIIKKNLIKFFLTFFNILKWNVFQLTNGCFLSITSFITIWLNCDIHLPWAKIILLVDLTKLQMHLYFFQIIIDQFSHLKKASS